MVGGQPNVSGLRITACAKVNLSLEVLGKRPDGFHEIRTVMQSISLVDELALEQAETLELECHPVELGGEGNLVMRAARMLQRVATRPLAARITLRKGIPPASGLGGASADAAAALVGLSELWGLSLPDPEMVALASSLGSDVPFFLHGGTAVALGRGEVIQPLPDVRRLWLVLLIPPHGLAAKTAELYRLLRPEHWSSGERTLRLAESISRRGQVSEELMGNCFESVSDLAFPGLASCREAMLSAGAPAVHLSGAGPALFSLFPTEEEAAMVAGRLSSAGQRPLLAHTLSSAEARPSPEPRR